MKDLTGQKFDKLTVLNITDERKHGHIVWDCICDCGNPVKAIGKTLRNGGTTSCGCNRQTHGESGTRLYHIWENVIDRVFNPNNCRSHCYSEKGVTICDEWRQYENFAEWAKNNGYQDDLTIDRIDVNGNYEPDNCRWATNKVQANNRTTNVYLEHDGKRMSLKDWSRETGLTYDTIRSRYRRGWSTEKILSTPKQNYIK